MVGNEIVCVMDPRGKPLEGFISGTGIRPGTIMQVKAGTPARGGRYTWEPYNRESDGRPGLIAVLNKDYLNPNGDANTAYANGARCFLYCPIAGEDINV